MRMWATQIGLCALYIHIFKEEHEVGKVEGLG